MSRTSVRRGFTLVELLVVIGIIAVLIAILLPTLQGVRRQADSIKCATSLKDLGNAMLMYVQDNKGYLPAPVVSYPYNVGGLDFSISYPIDVPGQRVADNARWFNLLAKYVMKGQPEGAATTDDEMRQQFQRTVVWGCPPYGGYIVASDPNSIKAGVNRNYPPYSMNRWPSFTASYPTPGGPVHFPTPNAKYQFEGARNSNNGTWYKLVHYTKPSDRALLADARALNLEARGPASSDEIPGQFLLHVQTRYQNSSTRESMYDFYRHGKYQPVASSTRFAAEGGKVAYNILYAGGHVATATGRETGYRGLRMGFPL